MKSLKMNDERYALSLSNNAITVMGDIDTRNPYDVLGVFLTRVHQGAVDEKVPEIHVDVKKLGFINSIGIKEFTTWIMQVDQLPDQEKYRIRFIINPDVQWQKLTFTSLKWLNERYVELKEEK